MTVFTENMGNYTTLANQRYKSRDPRWLKVEVCREFIKDRCMRSDDECRYAHPPETCSVEDGKVTACFDAMKGRCQRDQCKYLHPPEHIKGQLESLGRSFQHSRSRTPSQHAQLTEMLGELTLQSNSNEQYPNYPVPHSAGCYSSSSAESVTMVPRTHLFPRRADKSDKLKVCPDFLNGTCTFADEECSYAHSPEHIQVGPDGFVTVCMDFVKGHCQRSVCRYFHPPGPMVAQVKAAQYRPHQYNKHHTTMTTMQFPPQGLQMPQPMWWPSYYHQQLLNPYYTYIPQSGMPQQAYIVPGMTYGGPSPPPYTHAAYGESPNYVTALQEYPPSCGSATPSPSVSVVSNNSNESNTGSLDQAPVQ